MSILRVPPAAPARVDRPKTRGQELLRHMLQISVREIAALCDVQAPVVAKWLTGRALPTPEQRAVLEAAYGLASATWTQAPSAIARKPEES